MHVCVWFFVCLFVLACYNHFLICYNYNKAVAVFTGFICLSVTVVVQNVGALLLSYQTAKRRCYWLTSRDWTSPGFGLLGFNSIWVMLQCPVACPCAWQHVPTRSLNLFKQTHNVSLFTQRLRISCHVSMPSSGIEPWASVDLKSNNQPTGLYGHLPHSWHRM